MMTRKEFLQLTGLAGVAAATGALNRAHAADERPNILWISTEDIGPQLGCYGDPHAHTPTLDQLAAEGVRYTNAFTTAGVCAPNRSSIITGVFATTLGTQHMRSGGEGVAVSHKPALPEPYRCFTELLREAGYYCTNNYKEDYQFVTPPAAWDDSSKQAHWRNRKDEHQPFFSVFNYTGTHEGSVRLTPQAHAKRTEMLDKGQRQADTTIAPPPFHPDTPLVRRTWADYYELITTMDHWAADLLEQLEADGLAENTIVFFWSDHGAGMPRCKRWIYDSGVHVPVIVRIPEKWRRDGDPEPGTAEDRLVNSLDLGPTVLRLAGLEPPACMQGQAFLRNPAEPRQYVYAARDRMDERYDIIRMVRDKRYRYIRNYEPFKPYDQFMNTAEKSPIKEEMQRLAEAGELTGPAAWILRDTKPVEELYDTESDPHEVENLADKPEMEGVLQRLRAAHEAWMTGTHDLGLLPEPEMVRLAEVYGSRPKILPGLERDDPGFAGRLRAAAEAAGSRKRKDFEPLRRHAVDRQPAVRWWAMRGLAWLGAPQEPDFELLRFGLGDTSPAVRVAAAHGLLRHGTDDEAALDLLVKELGGDKEWVRLHAATALDEVGERARPAVPALREALNDKENKYVVRIANHALNELLGTNNEVR